MADSQQTTGASLSWKASIDYSEIPNDIAAIQRMFKELGVGIVNPDDISAPMKEAQAQIDQVIKDQAAQELKLREEVAQRVVSINEDVAKKQIQFYKDQNTQVEDQMKALVAYQEKINAIAADSEKLKSPVEMPAFSGGGDLNQILSESKNLFAQLDQETAEYVSQLLSLELALAKIRQSQQELDAAMDGGKVTTEEYAQATASLNVQQAAVEQNIQEIVQRQKDLAKINQAEIGSIEQKKLALEFLRKEYEALSEAERSGDAGKQLSDEIATLNTEIKNLDPTKLKEMKLQTISLSKELSGLLENMAKNPGSSQFDDWKDRAVEIQQSLANVRQSLKDAASGGDLNSITQKTIALRKLREEYSKLSDVQRDSQQGEDLKDRIQSLAKEIKALDPAKIEKAKENIQTARAELSKLMDQMARNPNSPLFESWRERATELKQSIEAVRHEIELTASQASWVDAIKEGVSGAVGVFASLTGAVALFTGENEEAEKAIMKTLAAMELLNGVQEVSKVLEKESKLNIFLTNLMRKESVVLTEAQTVAVATQTAATTAGTAAQTALNTAMLANPALLLVAAITALIGAYMVYRKRVEEAEEAQKRQAETLKKIGNSYAEHTAKIAPYLEALKKSNLTEHERLEIYKKLQEIEPKIVENLDAKSLSYENLNVNVQKYIKSLEKQIQLEANQEALTAGIKKVLDLDRQIKQQNELVELKRKDYEASKKLSTVAGGSSTGVTNTEDRLSPLIAAKEKLDELTQEKIKAQRENEHLIESNAELAMSQINQAEDYGRTVERIDEEIAAQKKLQTERSTTAEQYLLYQKRINELEAERKRITGESKKDTRDRIREDDALNAILKKRLAILEGIAGLERDAKQSGMIEEASELDKINEKYDKQILALKAVNKEIDIYNQRHPKSQINPLGAAELAKLEAAKNVEIANYLYKQDAKQYLDSLDQKQKAFEDFQQIQLEGNDELTAVAREHYRDQIGDYTSYLDFLRSESEGVVKKISDSLLTDPSKNVGNVTKLFGLAKAYMEEMIRVSNVIKQKQIDDLADMLRRTATYNIRRKELEVRYQKDVAALENNPLIKDKAGRRAVLDRQFKDDLEALKIHTAEESAEYRKLNDVIAEYGRKALKIRIADKKAYLKKVAETVGVESNYYKALQKEINDMEFELKADTFDSFKQFAALAVELTESIGQINDGFAQTSNLISGVLESAELLSTAFSKTADTSDKIQAGVAGVVKLIDIVVSSAKQRKKAEEDYYRQILGQQAEYNRLLNDQIGLQSELNESVFLPDFEGRLRDGVEKLNDANQRYQKALEKLSEGRAKYDEKLATDLQNIGRGIGAGAAAGAVVGSIVPVIGTAIGAAVGAVVGGLVGFFGGKKKKDEFGALLEIYPDLVKEGANGWEELNKELAQTLIDQNLVDETTKQLLQDTMDWVKQIEEAREQIKGVVSQLAGDLGNNLRDALVTAFEDGSDAGVAMANTVGKSLENILSQLIFNQVFSKAFKKLEDDMTASFDIGGDGSFIDDFGSFFDQAKDLYSQFYESLTEAQKAAADQGIDVFKQIDQASQDNSLKGAIKGMTEQQAELLAGQFGGLRMTAIDQLNVATSSLNVLAEIRNNTAYIQLQYSVTQEMKAILKDFQLSGLKVK
ncbi:glycine zipper domain-containing protein [Flavihumibacter petaseus]|uniref:Uncharacterized protein n=1 Tax=Flavihumibacter petaseus NBRC 106054 TaxID=1220578 RepID=A0A0E9N1R9_9BACT|nr:glycine zipper domain-containing protein [Flavihumibacter petaseus]GAO43799.1 hypothetical protein FPE01S_02_09050 [Flavihumibacter petaseus NBRC 106054]